MAVFLVNSRGIDVFPGGVISTRAQFPRFLVPSYLSDSKGEKERRRVPVSLFIPLAFSLAVARARARGENHSAFRARLASVPRTRFLLPSVPEGGPVPEERLAIVLMPQGEDLAAYGDHYLVIKKRPGQLRDRSVVDPLYPEPPRRFAIYDCVGGEFVAIPRYAAEITCCRRLRFNPP